MLAEYAEPSRRSGLQIHIAEPPAPAPLIATVTCRSADCQDREVRRWEPEPLRWLGVRGLYVAYRAADRHESGGKGSTSPIARLADRISGR